MYIFMNLDAEFSHVIIAKYIFTQISSLILINSSHNPNKNKNIEMTISEYCIYIRKVPRVITVIIEIDSVLVDGVLEKHRM